tara:strand:+ start:4906 stop:5175 length:270 start_codon:yes stop_codon:yes gene_type:complete
MYLDDIQDRINKIEDIRDLRVIQQFIKDRRDYLGNKTKYKLAVNDKVKVTSNSKVEYGVIQKINRTRAVVIIDGRRWNVPFSMITKENK